MAKFIAFTMMNNQYTGEEGNRSADHGSFNMNAAIGDTIDLLTIDAGTKFIGGKMINAALGAGSTISIGYRNLDGSAGAGTATSFIPATSTAAAGKTDYLGAPIVFTVPVVLYATVGGSAAAGQLDFVTDFIFQGDL